ncbi:hypothetical protein BV22DRAFT_491275 [Leucogyrophana mollusca]|uniref:Uncharacterized protein n=1 Tax=Leucogyrophana mollusca TaxID=85980 RepID=A0ACB8BHH5_9AGAM|nr:hypothetical protein BV22DRAFT_491275 [Leucogyrophana mollusca]
MVSLASAALKTPSVSYAERAKSGYSVRSSKDSQDASRQRSVHPVATSGLITSTSSQARTAESNASSGSVEAPNRTFNSNSGPPSDSLTENADDAHVSKRSTSTQVSQTVGQGAPVGNVWAARLREKAQAQALAQNFPQSLPTPSSMQLSLYTPSSSSPFTTAHNPPGTTQMPSVVPVARSNAPSINSAQSDLDADVDPFVVRMPSHLSRASSAALPVAPTDDIWPEVGAASTQAVHSRIYSGEPARESNEPSSSRKDGSSSSDQVAGPKKSEKTNPLSTPKVKAALEVYDPVLDCGHEP